jgi:hypothetical protein
MDLSKAVTGGKREDALDLTDLFRTEDVLPSIPTTCHVVFPSQIAAAVVA